MHKKYLISLFILLLSNIVGLSAQSAETIELAKNIAEILAKKASITKGKSVRLDYFTLDDTRMGSMFSRDLYLALILHLPKAGITVRENPNNLTEQKAFVSKDAFVVCGNFTEQGSNIQINAVLYDLSAKKPLAKAKATIVTAILTQQKTPWKPDFFEKAKNTRNLIVEDEATPEPKPSPDPKPVPEPTPEPEPSKGDFALELMTSKGFGHQIFNEGERMQIAVKTDRPCFLRLVYHAADGQKVLLLENEPMKTSDQGNYITVPQEFECAAPFGVETLQLFACTEVFPPLRTHKDNGFIFIDEEVTAVNAKTRSFKPVTGNNKNGKLERSEVSMQVTTMKR
jgi:hypothetical protein